MVCIVGNIHQCEAADDMGDSVSYLRHCVCAPQCLLTSDDTVGAAYLNSALTTCGIKKHLTASIAYTSLILNCCKEGSFYPFTKEIKFDALVHIHHYLNLIINLVPIVH